MKNFRIGRPPKDSHDWKMVDKSKRSYTEAEENFIKSNFRKMTDEEMAIQLKRTYFAVFNRRIKLRCIRTKTMPFKTTVKEAQEEVIRMRDVFAKVNDMKALIYLISNETSLYKIDKYKSELIVLSGL